ncbi:LacI family transcriptional regulator [Streptomyces spiroverticillatus]|uniref:LacI family transcriptional regulator n=1 Tax=Streptomyces finlayi TaxID=67296 RepID=A0A918X3V4_9ACTN|nr:substrate-binding domain-containing protein [Streptomyces finlayi]GHA28581.1 LacI family transcriptional regulator [Streptomyces spiroverticillatus]GHD09253.1 LacI family transcriptional regulator [Streptomyces finlayi]
MSTPSRPAARGEKFRRLAEELRRGVAELRWPDGRLPTEQQLAKEQGVSLNTVRRAVDLLVADGLVYRRQGSGTYIADDAGESADTAGGESVPGPVVGICVPSMTYYYPRIIAAIEAELTRGGAQMMIRSTGYDAGQERSAIDGMLAAGATGLLLVPELEPGADPMLQHDAIQSLGVPVVMVERRFATSADHHEFVCSNHSAGAYVAVRHLVSLGHRKIGYLQRHSPFTADAVAAGFRTALADSGLDPAEAPYAGRARWDMPDADAFLDELIAAGATAVVCFADREAALLVSAARRRGLSVPGDLSLVGYDDEVAELSEVPLTAVSPAKAEVGRLAARTLLRRIEDPSAPIVQQLVVPRLVVRDSTGPVG